MCIDMYVGLQRHLRGKSMVCCALHLRRASRAPRVHVACILYSIFHRMFGGFFFRVMRHTISMLPTDASPSKSATHVYTHVGAHVVTHVYAQLQRLPLAERRPRRACPFSCLHACLYACLYACLFTCLLTRLCTCILSQGMKKNFDAVNLPFSFEESHLTGNT